VGDGRRELGLAGATHAAQGAGGIAGGHQHHRLAGMQIVGRVGPLSVRGV
jgi:hypothetical protein